MDNYFFTIDSRKEIVENIEKSKFISQVFPVHTEEETMDIINNIRKVHYKATHNVYSYIIGKKQEIQKCTDDGEPSGTAGNPVLDVIKKQGLTNVLIIVTRYFGGVKLGAGGLIRAYAHMAKVVIDESIIIKNVLSEKVEIVIDYTYWGKLENECNKHGFGINKIEFLDKVYIFFYLQDFQKDAFFQIIQDITNGDVVIRTLGKEYIRI